MRSINMKTEQLTFGPGGQVPNNQTFAVVVYRNVGTDFHSADFEAIFSRNGWSGIWRNGVFDYHHYHSGAHEVLGVGRGEATLQIGGPEGKILDVTRGDCLILPAGTGHMKLRSSADFQVVGAYPPGQKADIQTSAPSAEMLERIRSLPKPETDPVHGTAGGLMEIWR
jgi:uncharacterized protein YjlB